MLTDSGFDGSLFWMARLTSKILKIELLFLCGEFEIHLERTSDISVCERTSIFFVYIRVTSHHWILSQRYCERELYQLNVEIITIFTSARLVERIYLEKFDAIRLLLHDIHRIFYTYSMIEHLLVNLTQVTVLSRLHVHSSKLAVSLSCTWYATLAY